MDEIFVYDNFFNSNELDKISNIIKLKNWNWGHKSDDNNVFYSPFWIMNLMDEEFFTYYLKNVLESHFSKKFTINRVYAVGQTFGQDGCFHQDDTHPNTFTVCLYLTNINKELVDSAGGYIYFKIPEKKFNICFEPLFNRLIMFPSNLYHKGNSYSRYFNDMRICITWKLKEII